MVIGRLVAPQAPSPDRGESAHAGSIFKPTPKGFRRLHLRLDKNVKRPELGGPKNVFDPKNVLVSSCLLFDVFDSRQKISHLNLRLRATGRGSTGASTSCCNGDWKGPRDQLCFVLDLPALILTSLHNTLYSNNTMTYTATLF